MRYVLLLFIILILLLIFSYNVINANEDKALYYPSRKCVWKPKTPYKSVYLNVNDPTDVCSSIQRKKSGEYISAWHFDNFKGKPTVLFAHGTTGNVSNRKYIIDICQKFKLNLLVFDYRGYGYSDGFPHKTFLKEDGEVVYHYLHDYCGIPGKEIIVWGESLGGVTSSYICSKYKCGGLILICAFSSLDDAITHKYEGKTKAALKIFTDILSYQMDMVPVKEYLKWVKCPVAIIHSEEDEIIPYDCSLINYDSVRHKKKLHLKIKGGHSSPDIKPDQMMKLFKFCNFGMEDVSSDIDLEEMLENLRTYAEKHHNFMSL
jgi:pimeloyl-ACP methyl ester carboxylesterase